MAKMKEKAHDASSDVSHDERSAKIEETDDEMDDAEVGNPLEDDLCTTPLLHRNRTKTTLLFDSLSNGLR
jgi:hypothetical protein